MNQINRIRLFRAFTLSVFAAATVFVLQLPLAGAQQQPHSEKLLAQKLVDTAHAKHPETDEVGISTAVSRGCVGIASTDRSDIGEKCEKADLEAMNSGTPVVEKERDGFDVTLPLHDRTGKRVGSVGIEFKLSAGQTETSVTKQAEEIASEMQAQIPSKASLFIRSR